MYKYNLERKCVCFGISKPPNAMNINALWNRW